MAIKDIVLPNGQHLVVDEWLHYPIYSTIEFASTASVNLRAFSYTVGLNVPSTGLAQRTATEMDTNQVKRNAMNYDEAFVMYALTFEHFALSTVSTNTQGQGPAPALVGTNLRRLQRDLVAELVIGAGINKPQFRAPFSYLRQAVGATAWAAGAMADHQVMYGTAGNVHSQNERQLKLPILIESARTMYLRCSAPVGAVAGLTQDVRLRFWLDGLKRRPIG